MDNITCPYCGSEHCIKKAWRSNKTKKRYLCKECGKTFTVKFTTTDLDIIRRENVKLAKQRQKWMDTQRIERKSFREYARIENALIEYNKELISCLKNNNLSEFTIKHEGTNSDAAAIVHFTDPHFNELVKLSINKYDFTIASQRCKKFIEQAKRYLKTFNVKNVLFAMTGDLLNSDRRLDELLSQATNRSRATFLAVQIIEQMLLDLNTDFNVSVACVTGNESRIQENIGWTELLATDNYDFTIFNILAYLFRESEGIKFICGKNPLEQIVNVGGQNVLLIHGHQIKGAMESFIQKIVGKYTSKGIIIDFVICGHKHSCRIGDTYARGSSIVGANEYSESGLQLISKASQNVHIIFNNKTRDSIRIDLQDIENVEGYDISKDLESYNVKSAERLHKKVTIFKVTI